MIYYGTAVCMRDIVRCPDLEKSGRWQLILETWRNGSRALEKRLLTIFLARAGGPVAQSIAVKRSFQVSTRRIIEANGQPVPDSRNGRAVILACLSTDC